jgi:hypothetical protein
VLLYGCTYGPPQNYFKEATKNYCRKGNTWIEDHLLGQWELQAEVLAEIYCLNVEERSQGVYPAPDEVNRTRVLAQKALMRRWTEDLAAPIADDVETIQAMRPVFDRCGERTISDLSCVWYRGYGTPHPRR